jgi:hypothetical protein
MTRFLLPGAVLVLVAGCAPCQPQDAGCRAAWLAAVAASPDRSMSLGDGFQSLGAARQQGLQNIQAPVFRAQPPPPAWNDPGAMWNHPPTPAAPSYLPPAPGLSSVRW